MFKLFPLALKSSRWRLGGREAFHTLVDRSSITDQLAHNMIGLPLLHASRKVFDLREAHLQVTLFSIRAHSVKRSLAFRIVWVVIVVCEEGGSHYFMNVVLVASNRFSWFE